MILGSRILPSALTNGARQGDPHAGQAVGHYYGEQINSVVWERESTRIVHVMGTEEIGRGGSSEEQADVAVLPRGLPLRAMVMSAPAFLLMSGLMTLLQPPSVLMSWILIPPKAERTGLHRVG